MSKIQLNIQGRHIECESASTILQAWMNAGLALTRGVGCMGQGICGACRVLVKSRESDEVTLRLACETTVTDGMGVAFLGDIAAETRHLHRYDLDDVSDGWSVLSLTERTFPQAAACRHCSGCDRTCPKQLHIETAVSDAVAGRLHQAAQAFEMCVMCNLCSAVCPEQIAPNHLGVFLRRALARLTLLPSDLLSRLRQIERDGMRVSLDAHIAPPAAQVRSETAPEKVTPS